MAIKKKATPKPPSKAAKKAELAKLRAEALKNYDGGAVSPQKAELLGLFDGRPLKRFGDGSVMPE